MNLLYVIIGGIIAMFSSVLTSLVAYNLNKKQTKKDKLINAYASWSVNMHEASDNWYDLQLYDDIKKMHELSNYRDIEEIPCSAAGYSREELVRRWRDSHIKLKTSMSILLLLEENNIYVKKVEEKTININAKKKTKGLPFLKIKYEIKDSVNTFMSEIQKKHPVISK